MESTGADGAGLTRHLHAAGLQVLEVNQPHPDPCRRRGKSDAIDAEAAARKALSGETTIIPKDTTGLVEAIRLGRVARGGAVEAYAAALCRLLVTAPEPLRRQVCSQPKTLKGRVAVCARLWPDPARLDDPIQAAKLALRATAERAQLLNQQARALQQRLDRLVRRAAPQTTALLGVVVGHAGQLLGHRVSSLVGDPNCQPSPPVPDVGAPGAATVHAALGLHHRVRPDRAPAWGHEPADTHLDRGSGMVRIRRATSAGSSICT